jgi:hypothetical protein
MKYKIALISRQISLLTFLAIFFVSSGWCDDITVDSVELYVSTQGDDQWSGRSAEPNDAGTDGPFATLSRARDAARALKRKAEPQFAVVMIRGGTYRLDETVVFTIGDGTVYQAYQDEKPIFSSGRPFDTWRRPTTEDLETAHGLPTSSHANVWVADVPTDQTVRTMFDTEGRLPRAIGDGFSPTNAVDPSPEGYKTLNFPQDALQRYANLAGAELRIVPSHFWVMNLLPIESIDYETMTLKTTVAGTYSLAKNGMTDRDNCWIENVLEVLDEPGEWVFDDTANRVWLWPRTEEPGKDVVAPTLTELIRVEGKIDYDGPVDEPVRGIHFYGLAFAHGDRLPWHGRTGWGLQHDWEMFDSPTALVRFRGAEDCSVSSCLFYDSGHSAVRLDLHCQNIHVTGNRIRDIGGVGILMAGYGPGEKDVNKGNTLQLNLIHDVGQEYWASVAIFAWQSGNNYINHNHIHHVPYTGVLSTGRIIRTQPGPAECCRTIRWDEVPDNFAKASWREREPFLHSRNNRICENEIHHAMERLGDGNCIYVSGAGGRTMLFGNYCHECFGDYMNAVIRCDDDQHDTLLEVNICCRTGGSGEGIISKGDNDILANVITDLRPTGRQRGYIVFPYGDITGTRIGENILLSRERGQPIYYSDITSGRGRPMPRLADASVNNNVYYCTDDPEWGLDLIQRLRENGKNSNDIAGRPFDLDLWSDTPILGREAPFSIEHLHPIFRRTTQWMENEPDTGGRYALHKRVRTRIDPFGQSIREPLEVMISSSDPNTTTYYTINGDDPTTGSTRYDGPFTIDPTEYPDFAMIRARSFLPDDDSFDADPDGASIRYRTPPAPIIEDFEAAEVGFNAPGAQTLEYGVLSKYSARVSDAEASSGRQSLRFFDGPGQEKPFTPHVIYNARFREGTIAGSVDLRVDANTSMSWQWREYGTGNYEQGPMLEILPGGRIVHQGRELTTIPVNEWVRIEVECALGDAADGTFALHVYPPAGTDPQTFSGLTCDPDFNRLDWIGFVSKAETDGEYYVDDMSIRPRN